MTAVSIVLSISALLFTLFSFWYLHARRGRVVASEPFTWSGYSREDGDARIRLPLALANSGPVGLTISDLRATLTGDLLTARLPWSTERSTLRPQEDDVNDFATPIVVRGRDVARHFVEFGGHGADPPAMAPGSTYEMRVEALVGWATTRQSSPAWVELFVIRIDGPEPKTRNHYITYPTSSR